MDDPINIMIIGPDLIKDMEQHVVKIKQHLKATHDKKKSYANLKKMHQEFKVGDHVYLQVKPNKAR